MPSSFSHKYPYTDGHELNLDWIIQKIKQLQIKVPDCPTDTDGQFILIATVSDGQVTYEWVNVN